MRTEEGVGWVCRQGLASEFTGSPMGEPCFGKTPPFLFARFLYFGYSVQCVERLKRRLLFRRTQPGCKTFLNTYWANVNLGKSNI